MLAHCRQEVRKIFVDESLKQFRRVFRKRKWLGIRSSSRYGEPLDGTGGTRGTRALKARRRGRPAVSRLKPHQAATTVRHILSGCPDQLSLPFALWTREAVQELLSRKFAVRGFGVDGRALFAGLGSDTAKTGATGVRTKSGGGTEVVGGRISIDSRTGATVEGPNSLVRRDGAAFGPSSGAILRTARDRRRSYGVPVSVFAAT